MDASIPLPAGMQPRRSRPVRLLAFVRETHPPLTYALVSAGWSMSLILMLQRVHGGMQINADAIAVGWVFFLTLLFLRAVDEVKDLDYDRKHNPGRPVVRGAVTAAEVWALAAIVAGLVCLASAWLAPVLAVISALQMLYGLLLLAMERLSRTLRDTIMLNLCVTFPVSAVLNVYAWLYVQERALAPALLDALPTLLAHVCIFLHMEFGRKLKWPQHTALGENGYVVALGVPGAIATCVLFALTACTLASWVHLGSSSGFWALLPWLALLPSAFGLQRFLTSRKRQCELKPWFGGAMLAFFLMNIAATLLS